MSPLFLPPGDAVTESSADAAATLESGVPRRLDLATLSAATASESSGAASKVHNRL